MMIAAIYLGVVGLAELASNVMVNPTGDSQVAAMADKLAALPSAGTLAGNKGFAAAALDLGAAAFIWHMHLRG